MTHTYALLMGLSFAAPAFAAEPVQKAVEPAKVEAVKPVDSAGSAATEVKTDEKASATHSKTEATKVDSKVGSKNTKAKGKSTSTPAPAPAPATK